MKWMTVKEYSDFKGKSLAAIYKQVKEGRVKFERKFGRLVIPVSDKS